MNGMLDYEFAGSIVYTPIIIGTPDGVLIDLSSGTQSFDGGSRTDGGSVVDQGERLF